MLYVRGTYCFRREARSTKERSKGDGDDGDDVVDDVDGSDAGDEEEGVWKAPHASGPSSAPSGFLWIKESKQLRGSINLLFRTLKSIINQR
jgi:hypothetical protein